MHPRLCLLSIIQSFFNKIFEFGLTFYYILNVNTKILNRPPIENAQFSVNELCSASPLSDGPDPPPRIGAMGYSVQWMFS